MADLIVLAIIAAVVGIAANYIVKSKKNGVKCIGCPDGCQCSHSKNEKSGCGGCGCHTK